MITLRFIIAGLILISASSCAFERCPANSTIKCSTTTLGKLELIWGQEAKDKQSRILLNGKEIFKNNTNQIGEDVNGDGRVLDNKNYISKLIIFYDFNTPQFITSDPQAGDLYRYRAYRLFDFSGKNVVISNEFHPPADYDAPLGWVSWGKKNTVISFKDDSRFRYENGRVTQMDDGTQAGDDN